MGSSRLRNRNSPPNLSGNNFSKREVEILALMEEGLSNQDLAEKTFLSLGTIKWYNKQIYQKLGVSNRTKAIAKAREMGLSSASTTVLSDEAARTKHNLPALLSSFIGRANELTDLLSLLQLHSTRLVTITGTGGIGKTALAVRTAEESFSRFVDGVCFVDLTQLVDPNLVAQVIANTLGIRNEGGAAYEELLVNYLRPRTLLIVLDNCEHLVEACASLVVYLLKACPGLRILATSREPLGVAGEALYPLAALPFPDPDQDPLLEMLKQYEAVQLFSQRAALVSPNFAITQENAMAVRQLCQRLDGIPLALELAAARVNQLSVTQIVEHLNDLIWKRKTSARTLLYRHSSLEACLDWSYSLLSPPECILLQRLSVFTAGWTLEAAVGVCADPPGEVETITRLGSMEILNYLGNLVNKSLVVANLAIDLKPEQEMRYRLLDTIHQYAHESLAETGEEASMRDRHLGYFQHYAEEAAPKLCCAEQPEVLRKMEADWGNLRAAMHWALAADAPEKNIPIERVEKGLRLGNALVNFWELRRPFPDGVKWLKHGLERIDPQDERRKALRARTLFSIGIIYSWDEAGQSPVQSTRVLEESITLLRACGNLSFLSMALAKLAWISGGSARRLALVDESIAIGRQVGDPWILADALWYKMWIADEATAFACGQESLALFRATGDPWRTNWTLAVLGRLMFRQGFYEAGCNYLEQSTRYFQERGYLKGMIISYMNKGDIAYTQKDFNQMAACFQMAIDLYRQLGKFGYSAHFLCSLGTAYKRLGDFNQAAGYYLESISKGFELGDTGCVCVALSGMAGVFASLGHPIQAVHLLGSVEAALGTSNQTKESIYQIESDRDTALARAQLDEGTFASAWTKGRATSLEEAIKEAFGIKVMPVITK